MSLATPLPERTIEDLDQAERTAASVVRMLTSSASVRPCDLAPLTDPMIDENYHHTLADIIEELRLSRLEITQLERLSDAEVAELAKQAPAGMSTDVWKLDVVGATGPSAEIWISTSSTGALSGLRLEAERPQPIRSLDQLENEVRRMDPAAGICISTAGSHSVRGPQKDVASLYKLIVLVALQEAIDAGTVSPDGVCHIEHFTPLSSGLTPDHIGQAVTVEDLARLMILRSDNTAADHLVGLLGEQGVQQTYERLLESAGPQAAKRSCVPNWHMHRYVEDAWGLALNHCATIEEDRTRLHPAHPDGHGFFIPMEVVALAMERAATSKWHPWPDPPAHIAPMFYKGGNAPGVRSSAYHRSDPKPMTIVVALNAEFAFGAIEDLYLTHCIESALEHLETPNPAEGLTPPPSGADQ